MITVIVNYKPYLDNSLNSYVVDSADREEAILSAIDQYIEDTDCSKRIDCIVCEGVFLSTEETLAKVLEVAPTRYWNSIPAISPKN